MTELIVRLSKKGLYTEEQNLIFEKNVLTLIGENGSGKSSILEFLFKENLEKDGKRIICFSSGQNERYSSLFNSHKGRSKTYRKDEENTHINSFYFNNVWARLLVFFASTLKSDGMVREYLDTKGYINQSDGLDVSSSLCIPFRIRKYYIDRIRKEIESERRADEFNPDAKQLRTTLYYTYLEKLAREFSRRDFDWETEYNLVKRFENLDSKNVFRLFSGGIDEIFTFWALATHGYDSNTILTEMGLHFKDKMEFKQLSDGEYQLLCIYALIDLFDEENTLFLLDEIDAHVYYKHIQNLWKALQNVKGKVITTTHLSDSILCNDINNIRLVEKGKIEQKLALKSIAKRLSDVVGIHNYQFNLAAKAPYIVLIDDVEFDWNVFVQLAIKKMGNEYDESKINQIIPIKCPSGKNSTSQMFALEKIEWTKTLKQKMKGNIDTKCIFMVCDRDNLLLTDINSDCVSVMSKDAQESRGRKEYLLSWRRREIENYLLSYTLLSSRDEDILKNLNNEFAVTKQLKENYNGDNDQVQNLDVKKLLQPLYLKDEMPNNNDRGIDLDKLDRIIAEIPLAEISEDIAHMYKFIVSKID